MKLLYMLLGAAGALLLKLALERRQLRIGEVSRQVPADQHAEGTTAEDEITGPLSEV